MTNRIGWKRVTSVVALGLLIGTAPVWAEVTRVDIERREDLLAGRAFGPVGPYEKILGRVHFAVDPTNPRNQIIADLDKAPRNAQGRVEFSADLFILKPKDTSRGNGVVFFDVVNRGNFQLLATFSGAESSNDPTNDAHIGDASLLRQGYTLVAVGWQFDVPKGEGLIGLDVPIATDDGQPITGWVSQWFIPREPSDSFEYTGGNNTPAYPPNDLESPDYRLTSREGIFAPRRLIPRGDWQFGRMVDGRIVADPNFVTLESGFKPGLTYEVTYESRNPPVAGLGLAAVRDMASALKYGSDPIAPGRYAYMYGSSQTGRTLRQIIYEGLTIDEQGRKVFDAAFVKTGGASMGRFNERFARPNSLGVFTQTRFPFQYRVTTDPVTGQSDGLGARIPTGLEPKIVLFDTASEYWDRGRLAALRHTSIDGSEDQPDAPNVRLYLIAGARHGAGSVPPGDGGGQFRNNTLNYAWAMRGLLDALDAWTRDGIEPPPSRHPTLADRTLVERRDLKFPPIPGVKWPTHVPGGYRWDVPTPLSALPFPVSNLDQDGNEVGGVRLPEQAVPLATFTGWLFRSERIGAPHTLINNGGSYIPFPATRAEREGTRDPRLSIEERYAGRADYLAKVEAAANRLAQERYVLQGDVPAIVDEAARHWDWRMAQGQSSSAPHE